MILEAGNGSARRAARIPRHAATPTRQLPWGFVTALVLIALLVPLHRWWAVQVLLVPLLLVVPGLILLRALRVPGTVVATFPVYVPCASIITLFCSGLVVDIAGPVIGINAPLRTAPVLAGLEIISGALLAVSVSAPADATVQWASLARPSGFAWPLILPLVAATGALRLNSGHGSAVAVLAVCGLVVMLITATVISGRLSETVLRIILHAAGLAVGWSYSLRGDGVYGFDISTEYQRLQQAITSGIWHAAHPNDAYGAMLSVTVMPAELHFLSGISGLLVFKLVYPVIYAFFPVAIFDLARRALSPLWAFVAAAFTIGQYAFTEIVSLARQEVGLIFFVALVAAMLDTRMKRSSQWPLITLLSLAMVVSHYSTTYVAITVIGLMLPLQLVFSRFTAIPRVTRSVGVAFLVALIGAIIWYLPVTQSDSHLLQVTQTIQAQGLNFLPNRVPGGSFLSAYLQGNTKTPISASQYQFDIYRFYHDNRIFIKPLPDAGLPQYGLRNSAVAAPPVKWRLGSELSGLALLVIEQLANVIAALGGLLMALRREAAVIVRQIGLLALVTTALLTLIRFSGTLAAAYGQERAQLQGLVLLAIAMCWAAQILSGTRAARQVRVHALAAACLAVILANTSYLVNAVLGGGTSANLANTGSAFETFVATTPELAAAQYLGQAAKPGQLVYADEYGQLPLTAITGIQDGLILDVTPQTLNDHAWVYASRANVTDRQAFALYNEHLSTYEFPAEFLDANYNLVYTNGSSEVFNK